MSRFLKKKLIGRIKKIKHKFLPPDYLGNKFICPVCSAHLKYFEAIPKEYIEELISYGFIYKIEDAETLYTLAYTCPVCKATDRDRLYALYIQKTWDKVDKNKTYQVVDFAPGKSLSKFIKGHAFINYRSADLYANDVDDKVDITEMPLYKSNSIDFFICSHVLEHVVNPERAISELYRILKPGGSGITMVPINVTLSETQEDPDFKTEADRWKHYGQGDHLRMYSKNGFINDLKKAGFKIKLLDVNYFGEDAFNKAGIEQKAVLYISEK